MNKLDVFIKRMAKIGIKITCWGNYPWVYIDTINGMKVIERFEGNHGFTIMFRQTRSDNEDAFTDITKIFELIRKYNNK